MINYIKVMEIYGEQSGYLEGLSRVYSLKNDHSKSKSYSQLSVDVQLKSVQAKNRAKKYSRLELNEAFLRGKKQGLKSVGILRKV
jgi:hypothetical protein